MKRRLVEDTATRLRLVGAPNAGRRKRKKVYEINNFARDIRMPNLLRERERERGREGGREGEREHERKPLLL